MTTLKNTLSENVFFLVNGSMINLPEKSTHVMQAAVLPPNSVVEAWVPSTNTVLQLSQNGPRETSKTGANKQRVVLRTEKRLSKEYFIISAEVELPRHVVFLNENMTQGITFYAGMHAFAVDVNRPVRLTSGVGDVLQVSVLANASTILTLARGKGSRSTGTTPQRGQDTVIFSVEYDEASSTERYSVTRYSHSVLNSRLESSGPSIGIQALILGLITAVFNGMPLPQIFQDFGFPPVIMGFWSSFIKSKNMDPFLNVYSTSGTLLGGCSCPSINLGLFSIPGPCYGGSGSLSIDISGLAGLTIVPGSMQFGLPPLTLSPSGFTTSASISGSAEVDMTGTAHLGYTWGVVVHCLNGGISPSISSGATTVDFKIEVPITLGNGEMTIALSKSEITLSNLNVGLLQNAMNDIGDVADHILGLDILWDKLLKGYVQGFVNDGNDAILSAIQNLVPTSVFKNFPDATVLLDTSAPLSSADLLSQAFTCFNILGLCSCEASTCNQKCGIPNGCGGICPMPFDPTGMLTCFENNLCERTCYQDQICGPTESGGCGSTAACPDPAEYSGTVCYNGHYCEPKCKGVGPAGNDSCGGTRCVCELWELPMDSNKICSVGPSPFTPNSTFYASYFITSNLYATLTMASGDGIENPGLQFNFGGGLSYDSDPSLFPDYWVFENVGPSLFTICAVYNTTSPASWGGASYYLPAPISPATLPWLIPTTTKADAAIFTISTSEKGSMIVSTTLNGTTYYLGDFEGYLQYVPPDQKNYFLFVGGCLTTDGPSSSALNCSWYPGSVCEAYKCVVPPS